MESIIRINELEEDIQKVKNHLSIAREFEVRHSLLQLLNILRTSLNEEKNLNKYKRIVTKYGL